jgi:hypothetical protein
MQLCQVDVLTIYHLVKVPFYQLEISSTFVLSSSFCVNLLFCNIANLETCNIVSFALSIYLFFNVPFHLCAIWSMCHFVNVLFHQLDIASTFLLSTGCCVNLPFSQLSVSLTCPLINMPFC